MAPRRRVRSVRLLGATLLAAVAAAYCNNGGGERITGITATGVVVGFVYRDANGSRVLDQGDDSVPGAKVRLFLAGRQDTGLVQTAGSSGFFRFRDVPVGVYALTVDTAGFGDTLQVVKIDSTSFTVAAADTVHVNALVGVSLVTVRQARAMAAGRRVLVVGVALSPGTAFADSTASVADSSGSIRLTNVRASFAAGDSLRVRAVTGQRGGQPTLDDPVVFSVGRGLVPTAATLTTAVAATAAGGTRDAQLVQVRGAIISDTARTTQSFVLTASDSSGPLEIQLDRTADPSFQPAALPGDYVPGNKFDVVGVLVPTGTGTWRLRPRSAADLSAVPLPVISIAAARALQVGRTAIVVGVALNSSGIFSDTTVYLADTSGAIRLTRLRTTVTAGDSVKVRATTASRTDQPTLDAGTATALGRGFYPAAATLTTAVAATAQGGTRDAQLVIVKAVTIGDTATVAGDFRLTVSDGSGNLEVLLDHSADQAFQQTRLPGVYIPGNRFDLVGLLQPVGAGVWRLRPRSSADLQKL